MSRRLSLTISATVAAIVFAAGCSSESDDKDDGGNSPAPATGAEPGGTAGVDDGGDAGGDGGQPVVIGDVDCALITDETAAGGLVALQIIPQMTSQSTIDAVKDGVLTLDTDATLAYLNALRPLADVETVLGTPGDEIEFYIERVEAAAALLAIDGPVPQAELDAFIAANGDVSTFITQQAVIGAAIDEVCR